MSAVLKEITASANDAEELRATMQLTPEAKQFIASNGALALAQSYEVDCSEVAQALADERKVWAAKIDRIKQMEKESLAPAKKMLEDMKAWGAKWFGPSLADLEAARELAGRKLLAWDQAEKARVAREQAEREALARRLRQEAEAKAAAERARAAEVAREAERKAQEAREAQAKALAEGNARAAAAAAAEAAKQAEKASAAVETGEAKAQAAQLQTAAMNVATTVSEPVKIAGQAVKDNWLAELKPGLDEDQAKALIVAEAVARPELLGLLKLDTSAVNKMAKALKGAMRVPGFTAANRPLLAGSRK